jgi:hypothetical protein
VVVPRVEAGPLDTGTWAEAARVELRDVVTGEAPRQATQVRVAWTGDALRFLFEAEDRRVASPFTEHDAPLHEAEVCEVFLDPYGHGRVYYEVQVSPRGVLFDAVVLNRRDDPSAPRDQDTLTGWDPPGLRAVVEVDGALDPDRDAARGWRAALEVPLAALGPVEPAAPGREWRLGLFRIDRHPDGDEYQAWSPTGAVDFHVPGHFGILEFGALP